MANSQWPKSKYRIHCQGIRLCRQCISQHHVIQRGYCIYAQRILHCHISQRLLAITGEEEKGKENEGAEADEPHGAYRAHRAHYFSKFLEAKGSAILSA